MKYLLEGQQSELERLRLQSRVWEPAGERLLAHLDKPRAAKALDVGCGAMGWLRLLSQWCGPDGQAIGTDVDDRMLEAARALCAAESLGNVALRKDDFFRTQLEPESLDLVHLRFQLAPLGRAAEQVAIAKGLARRGAWLVLEEPDSETWREYPPAPSVDSLRELILTAFRQNGGDFDVGRQLEKVLRHSGVEPTIRREVVSLTVEHPYLQLPLQFAASLRRRLIHLVPEAELDRRVALAREELSDPLRHGSTFTLVQAYGRIP